LQYREDGGRVRRSKIHQDVEGEWVRPDNYSMSAVYRATREAEIEKKVMALFMGQSVISKSGQCGHFERHGVIKGFAEETTKYFGTKHYAL
jgi:hypothetical protein